MSTMAKRPFECAAGKQGEAATERGRGQRTTFDSCQTWTGNQKRAHAKESQEREREQSSSFSPLPTMATTTKRSDCVAIIVGTVVTARGLADEMWLR